MKIYVYRNEYSDKTAIVSTAGTYQSLGEEITEVTSNTVILISENTDWEECI
jgi:hypothetical protein